MLSFSLYMPTLFRTWAILALKAFFLSVDLNTIRLFVILPSQHPSVKPYFSYLTSLLHLREIVQHSLPQNYSFHFSLFPADSSFLYTQLRYWKIYIIFFAFPVQLLISMFHFPSQFFLHFLIFVSPNFSSHIVLLLLLTTIT